MVLSLVAKRGTVVAAVEFTAPEPGHYHSPGGGAAVMGKARENGKQADIREKHTKAYSNAFFPSGTFSVSVLSVLRSA